MESRFAVPILSCAILAIFLLPALAIDSSLKPGLWEDRVSVSTPQPGSWIRPRCMAQSAPPPDINLLKAGFRDCQFNKVKVSATEISYEMTCKNGPIPRIQTTLVRPDDEHQSMHMIMTVKIGDKLSTNDATIATQWVGADCGDVKPDDVKSDPGAPPAGRMLDFGGSP